MSVRESAIELLTEWDAPDDCQDSLRQSVLAFLLARTDACERACVPGHITASALVVNHAGDQVLLTLHPRLGRWVQLGGHCEDSDADIVAAAMREVSDFLGNTPALARSSYVDPRVVDAYEEGRTIRAAVRRTSAEVEDDARLVPPYLTGDPGDDPAFEVERTQLKIVADELGLGRNRVLSVEGRDLAAQRWYDGEQGPDVGESGDLDGGVGVEAHGDGVAVAAEGGELHGRGPRRFVATVACTDSVSDGW